MGSIIFSQQNTFHFPIQWSYLLVVDGCLLCQIILMLSAERFVAPGFCLVLCKLTESACWTESAVCSLQGFEGGFYQNVVKQQYPLMTSSGGYTIDVLANSVNMIPVAPSKTNLCNTFPITANVGNAQKGLFHHDNEKALI